MSMTKKILIVEDCPDLLDLLGDALVLMGWETVLADSDREAMRMLEDGLPDVILLDMRMAAMDGVELAVILKSHPVYKNIPILGVGDRSTERVRKRCLALGCDDLIDDPIELNELEMRLAKILSRQRLKKIKSTGAFNVASDRWQPTARRIGRRPIA